MSTREQELNANVIEFRKELDRSITRGAHRISLFIGHLKENADTAFVGYADKAMAVAADIQVKEQVRAAIEHGLASGKAIDLIIKDLHTWALKTALNAAEYPERSTSVVSNFQAQLRGAAWAEMVRSLESL